MKECKYMEGMNKRERPTAHESQLGGSNVTLENVRQAQKQDGGIAFIDEGIQID
jgi:hypothetical protein